MRVDLTPLLPRSQPAGVAAPTADTSDPQLDPGQEMLALSADEVAAELSSLSVLIDAQPAADLSNILDSLSELAAELSQDVRDTEESLRLVPATAAATPAAAAAGRRQRALPCRQPADRPAYVTAGGGAETCPTPSCGGGQVGSRPDTEQGGGSIAGKQRHRLLSAARLSGQCSLTRLVWAGRRLAVGVLLVGSSRRRYCLAASWWRLKDCREPPVSV